MAIKDIAVSSGSACTSASLEPSYVLRALGRSDELAHSSIRFTIGRFSTEADIDFAVELLKSKVHKLRELSPLWDMFKDGIDIASIQWAATNTVFNSGASPWHTRTKCWTTTKIHVTSAPSTRATRRSAPAWSARRPAATS